MLNPAIKKVMRVFYNNSHGASEPGVFHVSSTASDVVFTTILDQITTSGPHQANFDFNDSMKLEVTATASTTLITKILSDGQKSNFKFVYGNVNEFVAEISKVHDIIKFYANVEDLRTKLDVYVDKEFSKCSCCHSGGANFKHAYNSILCYYYSLDMHPMPPIHYVYGDVLNAIKDFL